MKCEARLRPSRPVPAILACAHTALVGNPVDPPIPVHSNILYIRVYFCDQTYNMYNTYRTRTKHKRENG